MDMIRAGVLSVLFIAVTPVPGPMPHIMKVDEHILNKSIKQAVLKICFQISVSIDMS